MVVFPNAIGAAEKQKGVYVKGLLLGWVMGDERIDLESCRFAMGLLCLAAVFRQQQIHHAAIALHTIRLTVYF